VAKPVVSRANKTCCRSKLTSVTLDGSIKFEWVNSGGAGTSLFWWKSDHPPRHVHVYRDGTLVVKWDLDNHKAIKGHAPKGVLDLIEKLESEGLL
jgi:hypothetical protein